MDEDKILTQTPEEEMQENEHACGGNCCACSECPGAAKSDDTTPVTVVDIHFRDGGKVYYFSPEKLTLKEGENVIIDTSRGPEFGTVAAGNHEIPAKDVVQPLRKVLRRATEKDVKTVEENRKKEKEAFAICQKKIAEQNLEMQLVSAEYAFDGSKILFFFTAEGRVDFRELVKNLATVFHTRIELRQIGVRDKAKMVGGLGICGRPFCCKEFLDDFQPVSIKMAKTQNLSLNPTKISGTCGRLMCCLKYEQEAYEDLIKTAPKAESFVDTPGGRGTVTEVNLLRQKVRVRMEKDPDTFANYRNDEIYVIRSGKAKKTDTPIPEDFAPVSGNREATPRRMRDLDPMPEVVLGSEKKAQEQEKPQAPKQEGNHNNRRKGQNHPQQNRPQEKPAEKQKAPQQPAQQAQKKAEGGEKPKSSNHHRRFRRRKPGEGAKPQQ